MKPEGVASLGSRLIGGTAWTFTGRVVVALGSFAANVIAFRLLAPAEYGTFAFAQTIVFGGTLIAQLGLQRVATRLVAEHVAAGRPGHARAAVRVILRLGAATAGAVALFLASPPARAAFARFASTSLDDVAWIIGIILAVRTLTILRAETFRGFQEYGKATVFGGVDAQIITTGVFLAVWLVSWDGVTVAFLLGVLAASWVPGLVFSSVLLGRRTRELGPPEPVPVASVLRIAWPVLIGSVAAFALSQGDFWLVEIRLGPLDAARYGAAVRLVALVAIPAQIVNAAILPLITEQHTLGDTRQLERMVRSGATVATVPTVAALVAVLVGGRWLLVTLSGQDFYADAAPILTLLVLGYAVSALTGASGTALVMTGHERWMMASTLLGCTVVIGGGWVVAEQHGANGVALMAAIGLAVQNTATWIATRLLVGVWSHAGVAPALDIVRSTTRRTNRT